MTFWTLIRPSFRALIEVSVVESAVSTLAAGGVVVVGVPPAPLLLLVLLRLVVTVMLRRRPTAARRFGQVDADGLDAARILKYE